MFLSTGSLPATRNELVVHNNSFSFLHYYSTKKEIFEFTSVLIKKLRLLSLFGLTGIILLYFSLRYLA